jgi:hypothetical protein
MLALNVLPDVCECVAIEIAHATLVVSLPVVSAKRCTKYLHKRTISMDNFQRKSSKIGAM